MAGFDESQAGVETALSRSCGTVSFDRQTTTLPSFDFLAASSEQTILRSDSWHERLNSHLCATLDHRSSDAFDILDFGMLWCLPYPGEGVPCVPADGWSAPGQTNLRAGRPRRRRKSAR
jgi:hypothetical protein